MDILFALKAGLKGCPGGLPGSGKGSEPPATPALRLCFVLSHGVQGPGPSQRACVQSNWLAVCKVSAGNRDLRKNKVRVLMPQPTSNGPWHIRGPL